VPPDIIQVRRANTTALLESVRAALLDALGGERDEALGTHTTVYVTGSCGRGDMGTASDLDPYVVRVDSAVSTTAPSEKAAKAIASALRTAVERVALPELDHDGDYARLVTAESLFDYLGSPTDDETGALTKRMLLLLESRPLVNNEAYDRLLAKTINAYWRNEAYHPTDYLPFILVNDIVRYWRIVLLNHESRLQEKSRKSSLSPDDEMALRRYSSYKLRVPRCLSCFSALAYLLSLTPTDEAHVKREDIIRMSGMSPIERLEDLRGNSNAPATTLDALQRLYVAYLERTNGGKTELTDRLRNDQTTVRAVSLDGREFTRHMFNLIQTLGGGRALHRAIVV
jgi:predicted nucleotidyltransferase